jgi:hypothetical protein
MREMRDDDEWLVMTGEGHKRMHALTPAVTSMLRLPAVNKCRMRALLPWMPKR